MSIMLKKFKDNLKYIKLEDILSIFIFLFVLIPSLLLKIYNKIMKKQLWLICERKCSACDNGYHFYKYIRINYSNDYCFYVIDKKSKDYDKVSGFGNIIQWGSLKHWIYYLAANLNISTQKDGNPNAPLFYVIHVLFGLYNNRVFLQHGITINNGEWLYYKNTKFKYFICGAKREYEYIKDNFGYPDENVVYTGFARFDNLYDNKVNNRQILIMPTWRQWLGRETNSLGEKFNFEDTDYYKNWNGLLNDQEFINFLEKENLKVLFYPHANMQKYLSCFKVKSKNIKILDMKYDIQKALKESAIMITDYSSVFMDFAYMLKPLLFYQFDYDEFRKKQYKEGYYNYSDGFGPVSSTSKELIISLMPVVDNGMDNKYLDRMKKFFEVRDQKNCERIYNLLKN